ncbi:hypothetical protein H0H81_006403 [Sphagnurus paluster]|uniref:JmjC domain-containing protein n=1 Tax=Sphagnurus paluster TaxID=117069 RepID=A0A9P7FVJ9_9AGAR|nr:hypothetical protein H0H81_006403 [Sphagnurus paluster]
MNSLPDLAKKTSINSLLNPEASSDAFNTQLPNLTASQLQPHGQQVDVYGTPFAAPPSFHLRAASWGGPDDRRKPENGTRHYGMDAYQDHNTPRIARSRQDPQGYPMDHHNWQSQHDVPYGSSPITPMYSDERTGPSFPVHGLFDGLLMFVLLSLIRGLSTQSVSFFSHPSYYTPMSSMLDNYYQAQSSDNQGGTYPSSFSHQLMSSLAWQVGERASTRIVARGTAEEQRYNSSYYQPPPYHAQYQQESSPQHTPRVVQAPPKRRSPDDEFMPPKPKRAKQSATPKPASSTSKRGYPAKKRSEAAQIAAQNAKAVPQVSYMAKPSEKGKEKAQNGGMQIVPSANNAQALHPELQNTRCMSTKYKSDVFPRCVACTRRWAGDTCRFQGIRYFLRDPAMKIVGMSFSETQKADMPTMKFPTEWNELLTAANIQRTKKTIARALLPTLRRELEHLHVPHIIHRPREREVRATCDTCMTSIFSSSWLCRLCGREACGECYATVSELTAEQPMADNAQQKALQARREKHAHSNPFFLQCTKRIEHQASDFSPMSRFCEKELTNAISEMEALVKELDLGSNGESRTPEPPFIPPGTPLPESYPVCTTSNPFIPTNLSAATLSTPTLPIRRFANNVLTQDSFPLIWALGEPLVVEGLLDNFRIQWTPEYFVAKHGTQACLIIECQTEVNRRITVGDFFREFGRYEGRTECWKLKDWPPSMDFKKAFPELYEDFSNAVPVPSYVRRDGVLNIASHFPADTVAPDLGKSLMYNAMATGQAPGSKGTTRLHMDMADALNIMTYSSNAPDGSVGCAAWDIFRAEDSDKLRAFLRSGMGKPPAAQTLAQQELASAHDPIHGQQCYLDEQMRNALYDATGVKSYRFYQRPGEAVFIPAGCAHQVVNLADCIKVAVDFVSPENVERCERLTREFREQNQRKVWKEDVLQLRTMMWFAWLSCRNQEGFEINDDSGEDD